MPLNVAFTDGTDFRAEITDHSQTIFASLPDTILLVNRAGIILSYKLAEQYLKLIPSNKVLGQHISDILPWHPAMAATEAIATVLNTGKIQLFEYNLTLEQKPIYFEARVTKAGDEETLIIIRDISEWRRSEACDLLLLDIAVKVQEERSLEENISRACERMMAIFGVRLMWVERKETDSLVKCFASGEVTAQFLQENTMALTEPMGLTGTALRTGKFQLMDVDDPRMLPWRDQLAKNAVTTGAAFPLKVDGQILGVLAMFSAGRDFWTKRTIGLLTHFAEQIALVIHVTANRQRLKILTTGLESAANAIVITSRKGAIQWVNPAFLELNGYCASDLMSSNVRMLEPGQYPQSFYIAMWRHVLSGRIWHGEIINRRKDGSGYNAEMTITPVRNEMGIISNFIAIIQDITQRKQAECELLEAREAVARAERVSAMGIMAAGIAHEINQPLNALKVRADGMLYWYNKGRVPEISNVIENIREISKDADRIDTIIKHMRSHIYNSDPTELRYCNINLSVEESLVMIGSQLQSHNIDVKLSLFANLPLILGNCTQLEQIIINILINAMYSLDTVEKPDKQIRVVTGCRNGQVFLEVSDNGPGISENIKNKIFDAFFTTRLAGKGMGLGLSVVHSIVTSYGGQIKVNNNKQAGGVTFQIEFPVATDKQKGAGSA